MLEFLIVLVLIACNAFFALSEMSVVTSRKSRLRQRAGDSRAARKALELANEPERFLSTVQVGITLIGILTGMFGGRAIGQSISEQLLQAAPALAATVPFMEANWADTTGLLLAVSLITYLTIIFGELLPKRLALLAPERIASLIALPMNAISRVAKPAVWLLSSSVHAALRLLRLSDTEAAKVSEEEILLLVSESHEQGVIDDDERNMMNRVLQLGDRSAESLMTPRTRIVWLDDTETFEENMTCMRATPFSRYPVYRDSDAEVIGVLEVKSLLDRLDAGGFDLFANLRKALFVSESTPALKLLEIFREEKQSLALVVDEYGDISGLITVNDLLEAVIGRTRSGEGEGATALVVTRDDGSMLVDGAVTNDTMRELLGSRLPDELDHDYHTAAGMVIAHFGRIPNTGEWFEWAGWRIEVVDLDGPRVDKLLLQKLPEPVSGDDD